MRAQLDLGLSVRRRKQRPPSGADLKREGTKRVAGGDPEWQEMALAVLEVTARAFGLAMLPFTNDDWRYDMRRFNKPEPHDPNCWGAAAVTARRRGIIEDTGEWVNSKRPLAKSRKIPVWRAGRRA